MMSAEGTIPCSDKDATSRIAATLEWNAQASNAARKKAEDPVLRQIVDDERENAAFLEGKRCRRRPAVACVNLRHLDEE